MKQRYREGVERLYWGGSNVVGKQHFTQLYDQARSKAFTPRNILPGWSKTGLQPFNPDRVLQNIQKPEQQVAPITLPTENERDLPQVAQLVTRGRRRA
jgi:hypothetical protein